MSDKPSFNFVNKASNQPATSTPFGSPTIATSGNSGGMFGAPSSKPSAPGNSFGASSSTAPNAFGGTAPANPTSSSLFGGQSSATPSGGSSLFGGSGSQAQAPQAASPFGGTSGGPSGGTSLGGMSLGGSKPGSGPAAFSFGQQATLNKISAPASGGQTQTSGLFSAQASAGQGNSLGGQNNTNTSQAGSAGSFTPTASKPPLSFGQPSTTPAGPPPSGSGSTGGVFALNKPAMSSSTLFGASSTANRSGATSQAPSTGLFGQSNAPASTPTASKSEASGSPFSATPAGQKSNLFGNTQGLPGGLFGTPSTQATNTSSKNATSSASGTNQQSATPNSSNLFGTPATSSAPKPAATPLFGAVDGSTSSSETSKPTFSFPPPSSGAGSQSAGSTSTPTTSTATSNLFGATPNSSTPATGSTQSAAAPSNLFGGFGKPASTAAPTTSAGTTGTAASAAPSTTPSFNIGGLSTSQSQAMTSAPGASSTAATSGTASTSASQGSMLGSSTAGPAPTPQSRLKNKSMDEIIQSWATELSKHQKSFQTQAEKVAEWDRLLIENQEKLVHLFGVTFQAEKESTEIERQLTSVEGQQEELVGWIDRYEREVDDMISKQVGSGEALQGPDQERERTQAPLLISVWTRMLTVQSDIIWQRNFHLDSMRWVKI
jgi:nuclear pore complex protein Nup62